MKNKKAQTKNILFCGVGGQGILKSSELCAWAAILEGWHVKKSEVHGMAQRGGSVESHLRFGSCVYSPLIPKGEVDFLVAFDRAEHERFLEFLKPKGVSLINYLGKATLIVKEKKYINTFLLGVLSKYLNFKQSSWIKAIEIVFSKDHQNKNKEIFKKGSMLI